MTKKVTKNMNLRVHSTLFGAAFVVGACTAWAAWYFWQQGTEKADEDKDEDEDKDKDKNK